MALLSLDRHDVLETIRQSNSLHEAFLRAAKLPAVGEYRKATNADRFCSVTGEELANALAHKANACWNCSSDSLDICKDCWLDWLKQEVPNG